MLVLLDNVTKSYAGIPAVKNVNLAIEAGEMVLLYGPSGAGKTTLLKLIGCLEKPDEGKIYLESQNVSRLRAELLAEVRRREIGFLTAETEMIPVFTVQENVELPLQLLKQGKGGERRERVKQLLAELDLEKVAGKRIGALTPLERAKTALAAALIKSPSIILADEPTARLALASGLELIRTMAEINQKKKTTFLVASDDPAFSRYLTRTVKIYGGVIEGEPRPAGLTLARNEEVPIYDLKAEQNA
ncbi:MAG: ATP-binding cassette domain-containing protein [Candidatus Margulisiibacteriota bacterium]|jgi:putative ABC transport system ATP-binding protein